MQSFKATRVTVRAYGDGHIKTEDMPVDPKTNKGTLRYAPSFSVGEPSDTSAVSHPYTVDSLARAMGKVKVESNTATNNFVTAFAIVELTEEGYISESKITTSGKDGKVSAGHQ